MKKGNKEKTRIEDTIKAFENVYGTKAWMFWALRFKKW